MPDLSLSRPSRQHPSQAQAGRRADRPRRPRRLNVASPTARRPTERDLWQRPRGRAPRPAPLSLPSLSGVRAAARSFLRSCRLPEDTTTTLSSSLCNLLYLRHRLRRPQCHRETSDNFPALAASSTGCHRGVRPRDTRCRHTLWKMDSTITHTTRTTPITALCNLFLPRPPTTTGVILPRRRTGIRPCPTRPW